MLNYQRVCQQEYGTLQLFTAINVILWRFPKSWDIHDLDHVAVSRFRTPPWLPSGHLTNLTVCYWECPIFFVR